MWVSDGSGQSQSLWSQNGDTRCQGIAASCRPKIVAVLLVISYCSTASVRGSFARHLTKAGATHWESVGLFAGMSYTIPLSLPESRRISIRMEPMFPLRHR